MNFAIRVDASARIGIGHAVRCLTLAHHWRKKGNRVKFICREHKGNLARYIKDQGFDLSLLPSRHGRGVEMDDYESWLGADWAGDASDTIEAIRQENIDWLVTDHYGINQPWMAKIRSHCKRIMVIDELANRYLDTDILLDQTLNCPGARYNGKVPESCVKLLGLQYALLRPEFSQKRPLAMTKRAHLSGINNILISLGGTDPDNFTGRVLRELTTMRLPTSLEINIVLSRHSPHIQSIEKTADRISSKIKFYIDTEAMASLMLAADLAIGTGGTTSWERCCLGLPSIVICAAENQKAIIESLVQAGIAVSSDNSHLSFLEEGGLGIARLIQLFMDNTTLLHAMSSKAFELCDGKGVQRTTEILENINL